MIKLINVSKSYELGSSTVQALLGINLEVEEGQFLGFHGPSGSGKTTLLRIIGLLDTPDEGKYLFDGKELSGKNHRERSSLRGRHFGFIFQTFNLIPELTVYENVEIPLMISRKRDERRGEKVRQICEEVGLGEYLDHRPGQLSGGQMQRVSIARALVKDPAIVLADEPTANLDTETGNSVVGLMRDMNKNHGATFLFATHDPNVTDYLDEIISIIDGKLQLNETAKNP